MVTAVVAFCRGFSHTLGLAARADSEISIVGDIVQDGLVVLRGRDAVVVPALQKLTEMLFKVKYSKQISIERIFKAYLYEM